jgi:5-methylcytosine-specific restriction endonuclease McrA
MIKWLFKLVCDWLFNPKQIEGPKNKHKKAAIPKKLRDSVWVKYYGTADKGICYSCGIQVNRYNAGWNCSHVKSDAKGGSTTIDNLRVCCPGCNLTMGNQNMYAFIRDKNMTGPGSKHYNNYFKKYPNERFDKRTCG